MLRKQRRAECGCCSIAACSVFRAAPAKPGFRVRARHGCGIPGVSEGECDEALLVVLSGRRFCLNDAPAQSNRLGCHRPPTLPPPGAPQGGLLGLRADRTPRICVENAQHARGYMSTSPLHFVCMRQREFYFYQQVEFRGSIVA